MQNHPSFWRIPSLIIHTKVITSSIAANPKVVTSSHSIFGWIFNFDLKRQLIEVLARVAASDLFDHLWTSIVFSSDIDQGRSMYNGVGINDQLADFRIHNKKGGEKKFKQKVVAAVEVVVNLIVMTAATQHE